MVWKEAVGPSLPSATGGQGAGGHLSSTSLHQPRSARSPGPLRSHQGLSDHSLDPEGHDSKSGPGPGQQPSLPGLASSVPFGSPQLSACLLPHSGYARASLWHRWRPRQGLSRGAGAQERGQGLCCERVGNHRENQRSPLGRPPFLSPRKLQSKIKRTDYRLYTASSSIFLSES